MIANKSTITLRNRDKSHEAAPTLYIYANLCVTTLIRTANKSTIMLQNREQSRQAAFALCVYMDLCETAAMMFDAPHG